MGVYLSEPNKEKHFAQGSDGGISFVSAEMQGTVYAMKVGEKPWKTQLFIILTLGTETLYLLYLTAMEVRLCPPRVRSQ